MKMVRSCVLVRRASRTRRAVGVLIGLVLLWSGCTSAHKTCECGRTPSPARALALRVMTFNIRYGTAADGDNRWARRKELAFEVIRRERPDIACLQEALDWQIEDILHALPAYDYVGVGRDDGKSRGEYAPILYSADRFEVAEQGTFWLSATPEQPGSMTWGNHLPRICTWVRLIDRPTGRSLHVYNVHLDHESQPSRQQAVMLLAQRIRDRSNAGPLIVAGDFNAGEDNPAIQFLTGQSVPNEPTTSAAPPSPGLVDTFRIAHPAAQGVGTFHGFDGYTSGPKIDYILAPPTVHVRSAEIVRDQWAQRYPSDHFPVTAQLLFD